MSVPAGAEWTVKNGKINGQTWSRQLTGRLNASSGNTATYLATATIPGTWTASAPTVTYSGKGISDSLAISGLDTTSRINP